MQPDDLPSLGSEEIRARLRELDVLFLIPAESEEAMLALLLEYIALDEELGRRTDAGS
ncbi:MAG: hypothetical protein BroJett013_09260 [Alphaproteobacteria bacterium]|nr:MAG: hypothetical protein BroJett013_09260 [Alphaproteobacteria bacterium]